MFKRLRGQVQKGVGDAKNWGIAEIREATGCCNLKEGTLNVKLSAPHDIRKDHELLEAHRKDGRPEDLHFERCYLLIGACRVSALIARTSTNAWGTSVLEIMAEEMLGERYGLKDGDSVDVEVWVESNTSTV